MTATGRNIRKASRTEIVKVNDILKTVLITHSDGLVSYIDGHSDETVSAETGATVASVEGIRRELFGKLQSASRSADRRVEDVVKATENIITCYNDLKDRYNKLIKLLALNKVVDCRHLEIK